jgi:LemA protein
METTTIIIVGGGTLLVLGIWVGTSFNSLVGLRNDVKKGFSGIDVQLKRRTDLIPNLINTVKGYAKHEKEVLESVTKARTSIMNASESGDVKGMAQGENMLSGALKSVFAVAESYPDLKANKNFIKLQEELGETEDQIAASRRIYNENATYFNNKIEMFPSNVIAGMFNFRQSDLFEATAQEREHVKVEF